MSLNESHTALVVGAGPAGSAAALQLALLGHKVRLFDRAYFPRDKVCGDVLLYAAQQSLQALGVDTDTIQQNSHLVNSCRYHSEKGRVLDLPFVDRQGQLRPWWCMPRQDFDQHLLATARAAGVQIFQGFHAQKLLTDSDKVTGVAFRDPDKQSVHIHGPVVIAADGASSSLARSFGRFQTSAKHVSVALRAYVDLGDAGDVDYFSVFASRWALPGYAWIVPLGNGQANIGLGVLRSDMLRLGLNMQQILQKICQQHPLFAQAVQRVQKAWQGWRLPGAFDGMSISSAGVLFAGDAASMVDPFTAHGIHSALDAGRLAGQVAFAAMQESNLGIARLQDYDRRWLARWHSEFAIGQMLQRLGASHRRIELLMALAARSHDLRDYVGGLVGHAFLRRQIFGQKAEPSWEML